MTPCAPTPTMISVCGWMATPVMLSLHPTLLDSVRSVNIGAAAADAAQNTVTARITPRCTACCTLCSTRIASSLLLVVGAIATVSVVIDVRRGWVDLIEHDAHVLAVRNEGHGFLYRLLRRDASQYHEQRLPRHGSQFPRLVG